MAIAPDIIEKLLVELCRFLIEAADLARETAPLRGLEAASYSQGCAIAAIETLRSAIHLRDRDLAREPLRGVAARLGLTLDEADPDWQRLAIRALRAMMETQAENIHRDQGLFDDRSGALRSAISIVDQGPACHATPVSMRSLPLASGPVAPRIPTASPPAVPAGPHVLPRPVGDLAVAVLSDPAATAREDIEPFVEDGPSPSPANCPTITAGTEFYIGLRSEGYTSFKPTEQVDRKSGESWARNSGPNVRSTGRLFARALGDRPFDRIGRDELTQAWDLVARLPRSYQARTSKLSPRQSAEEADVTERRNADITRARMEKKGESPGKIESRLLMERIPRLRTATIYRHMQDFQRICVCFRKKGLLSSNIMEAHIWDSKELERRVILEEDNDRLTWCGKLDGLFRSPIFQDKLEEVGDPLFWAPLVAVHMGLRSEEILQLHVTDVQVLDGIPCIVLRKGPGQNLKSLAARRTVPIHENLLELGFLKLVALRERDGETHLFPWLERSQSKKTFTESFSKRFTRYRQENAIYDRQRDFHSFRTTFNHRLIEAECPDTQRRGLMGHVERDFGITNYNPDGFSKALLAKRVNSVFVDIAMIRPPFERANPAGVTRMSDYRGLVPA